MAVTSRYIQVTNWCLLEYEYSNEEIQTSLVKAYRITNFYDNSFQFVNGDIALNITRNVQDTSSAIQNSIGNKWGYLDIDTIIPIINQDNNLLLEDQTNNLSSPYIKYDTVKLHIVSGFNLEGIKGIIIQISIKDNTGMRLDLANHTFLSSQNDYKYNEKPIFLGDRLYDKYIEFKIPSLNYINTEFYSNPSNLNSFGSIYSKNNVGFPKNALIDFTLHEITNIDILNGNQYFITGQKYELSFLSVDQFSLLGATIKESNEGDYFEYYATWDNGFIKDYIANLNEQGGDWVVIHQLEVFEQIGTNFIKTSNMTILQDDNFDKPMIFRPVILNSDIAFSFSIDYIMRFLNRKNGEQIIRKSSITSYEPKKYGKQIEKITVLGGYKPLKVYNKIIRSDEQISVNSFHQNSPATFKTIQVTKYVPNFYNNTNIAITTNGMDTQELDETIWGQGKAIILLNEFDNRIRFKIFIKNESNKEFESLNLTTEPNLFLAFIFDDGTKKYIPQTQNNDIDPINGEVEFLIPSELSIKILKQKNKKFYIISRGGESDIETVIYQGSYENFANREKVIKKLNNIQEKDIREKIKKLKEEREKFLTQKEEFDKQILEKKKILDELEIQKLNLTKQKTNIFVSKQSKLLQNEEEKTRKQLFKNNRQTEKQQYKYIEELKKFRDKKKKINANFKLKEVPGKTIQLGSSIKAIKPKVIKPSDPKTTIKKIKKQ